MEFALGGVIFESNPFCEHCRLPSCRECKEALRAARGSMFVSALAYNVLAYYAPRDWYTVYATVLEIVCTGVRIATTVCFHDGVG